MSDSKTLYDSHVRFSELDSESFNILAFLLQSDPFCVFIKAPMGSGKTTLVSHMLRGHGLDPKMPVVSPTYTIVNDYEVNGDWFAHMDFYRAGPGFSLQELGVLDSRRYRGLFVEWPEIPPEDLELEPTHDISISFVSEDTRRIVLSAR